MQARRALLVADALTIARLPLAIAAAALIAAAQPWWALAVVAVAGLTDAADGNLARWARRHGAVGDRGAWLDPVADKLFVVIVVGAVVMWSGSGAWVSALLVGAREVVLVPMALAYRLRRERPLRFQAHAMGKIATDVQMVAIGVLVALPQHALPFAIAAAATGLAAVLDYAWRATHVTREATS